MVERSAPPARPASGTTPRIARVLIVDDDPHLSQSLRLLLEDEFEVTATCDPAEALGWMLSGDWYDVVLCDVQMPHMSGVELATRVDAARPELAARIVFMTGGIVFEDVHKLLEGMPNLVLAKPFDTAALRELIRRRTVSRPPPRRASQP